MLQTVCMLLELLRQSAHQLLPGQLICEDIGQFELFEEFLQYWLIQLTKSINIAIDNILDLLGVF